MAQEDNMLVAAQKLGVHVSTRRKRCEPSGKTDFNVFINSRVGYVVAGVGRELWHSDGPGVLVLDNGTPGGIRVTDIYLEFSKN